MDISIIAIILINDNICTSTDVLSIWKPTKRSIQQGFRLNYIDTVEWITPDFAAAIL